MSLLSIPIPKRSLVCALNQENFLPKMAYFSVLYEELDSSIVRKDFCEACWSEWKKKQDLSKLKGYWKAKVRAVKKVPPADKAEKALLLLQELQDKEEEDAKAKIYLLATFLLRLRRLALRKEFSDHQKKYHLYEIIATEQFLQVEVLDLSLIEIEKVRIYLADQLKGLSD